MKWGLRSHWNWAPRAQGCFGFSLLFAAFSLQTDFFRFSVLWKCNPTQRKASFLSKPILLGRNFESSSVGQVDTPGPISSSHGVGSCCTTVLAPMLTTVIRGRRRSFQKKGRGTRQLLTILVYESLLLLP